VSIVKSLVVLFTLYYNGKDRISGGWVDDYRKRSKEV